MGSSCTKNTATTERGGGQKLGGTGQESDSREARAAAAEARAAKQSGSGASKTYGSTRSRPTAATQLASAPETPSGHVDSGMSVSGSAAMARAQSNTSGISAHRQAQMEQRAQRDALIGKIEAIHASRGTEPPFGLRAASMPALQKQLAMLRG